MRRRTLLALVGSGLTSVLAGCSSGDSSPEGSDGGPAGGPDGETEGEPGGGTDGDSDGGTDAGSDRVFEPLAEGTPDVTIGDGRLVGRAEGYSADGFAAVTVENAGEGVSGEVGIDVAWQDAAGETIHETTERITFLRAGETWEARIFPATAGNTDDIDAVVVSGEARDWTPQVADQLSLAEPTVDAQPGAGLAGVETTATNEGDEPLSSGELVGRVFDEDGTLLGDGADRLGTEELAPGDAWDVRATVALYQQVEPSDFEAVPLR